MTTESYNEINEAQGEHASMKTKEAYTLSASILLLGILYAFQEETT